LHKLFICEVSRIVVNINRRQYCKVSAVLASALASGLWQTAQAQGRGEKTKVNLAVAGKTSFYYLPLIVAEQLGFFEAEGIALEIVDFPSSVRAQQALASGNADVVCGAFEHLINLHSKHQYVQSFVALGRAPQMAMGVSVKNMPNYKRLSDLRGKRIGIAAPGTGTNIMANMLLQRAGLQQNDVSYIGVGTAAGVISAVRTGQVDAICNLEPAMTQLELKGDIKIIADSRTLRGTQAIFGGDMPGACLFALPDYIQKNRLVIQAMTNAIVRALKWLQTAGPRDLLRGLPEAILLGDRGLFLATFQNMRESISLDGVTADEAARLSLKVMASFDAVVKADRLDISKAYTNMFAKQAKSLFDA
jgi:NitT/TauT family transport system substrate-binding protein